MEWQNKRRSTKVNHLLCNTKPKTTTHLIRPIDKLEVCRLDGVNIG